MGGQIVMEWEGQDSTAYLMWNTAEMSKLDAALTGVPLTLSFQGQIVSREWEARFSWNEGVGSW